jgi:hypothetical protein
MFYVKSIVWLLGINNTNIFRNTVLNRLPDSRRKEIILNVVNHKLINNFVIHVLCTQYLRVDGPIHSKLKRAV